MPLEPSWGRRWEDSLPPTPHGLRTTMPPDGNEGRRPGGGSARSLPLPLREAAQEEGFFVVVTGKGENDICVSA